MTVVQALDKLGLFRGTSDNPMRIGLCSRSKDVIEPCLKPQWWVKCDTMAARACEAVRNGTLEIIPKVRGRAGGRDWGGRRRCSEAGAAAACVCLCLLFAGDCVCIAACTVA